MNEDKLTASARQLATEMRPERDLWPGIEAAIAEPAPRRSRWTPWLAQAAAVVLLIGASSGITYLAVKDDGSAVVPEVTMTSLEVSRTAFGSDHTLSSDYEDARAELFENLETELGRLSPEERQDVVTSLGVIRGAIDDINAALAEDPDNTFLQDLLMKTYREELRVMRQVGGGTQSIMLREDI
jgi:hypothetical protein